MNPTLTETWLLRGRTPQAEPTEVVLEAPICDGARWSATIRWSGADPGHHTAHGPGPVSVLIDLGVFLRQQMEPWGETKPGRWPRFQVGPWAEPPPEEVHRWIRSDFRSLGIFVMIGAEPAPGRALAVPEWPQDAIFEEDWPLFQGTPDARTGRVQLAWSQPLGEGVFVARFTVVDSDSTPVQWGSYGALSAFVEVCMEVERELRPLRVVCGGPR